MYQQVHVPHFANLMPYRQFLSPVYVPPMAMPGYSSNPAYTHPSNANSYLLMPGGSSHLGANGLKYGIQQLKPVPAGSPTGFGNFTNPTGYAINAPGVVGSATGLEDSSRVKYKDGNIYVPNPQAETLEIWIQNPRELPGLQFAPYYNMPAQTPHAAYMPSHTGHASFNVVVAAAQSSHMQFHGLYHSPPQPAAMASPHHLGPTMGGNVGVRVVAATPGPQVDAYQQPQLSSQLDHKLLKPRKLHRNPTKQYMVFCMLFGREKRCRGFFKGLQAQILKTALSSALLLMIKEKIAAGTWVLILAARKYLLLTESRLKSAQKP